jgi:hypothetical protein
MMSGNKYAAKGQKTRQGQCHNCGWNQSLHKVTGSEAALIHRNARGGPRFGLRWLCEECVLDLTSSEPVQPVPTHAGSFRLRMPAPVRHRSVA